MDKKYQAYEPAPYNVTNRIIDEKIRAGLGGRVAVYYRDRAYTYRQLQQLMNKAGNILLSLGAGIDKESWYRFMILRKPWHVFRSNQDWRYSHYGQLYVYRRRLPAADQ